MEMTFVPLALLGAAILLLVIFFYYVPFLLWISAKVSGVNISLIQLFLMRIRNVPPYVITRAMIEAHKAGLKTLTRDELEAHYPGRRTCRKGCPCPRFRIESEY